MILMHFFRRLSSAGTALGTCFCAVLRATLGVPVGLWGLWSSVLLDRRPRCQSSFRDHAVERTHTPHAVMEAALAHGVRNKVEAAYARSDLFEKRRALMESGRGYLAA